GGCATGAGGGATGAAAGAGEAGGPCRLVPKAAFTAGAIPGAEAAFAAPSATLGIVTGSALDSVLPVPLIMSIMVCHLLACGALGSRGAGAAFGSIAAPLSSFNVLSLNAFITCARFSSSDGLFAVSVDAAGGVITGSISSAF